MHSFLSITLSLYSFQMQSEHLDTSVSKLRSNRPSGQFTSLATASAFTGGRVADIGLSLDLNQQLELESMFPSPPPSVRSRSYALTHKPPLSPTAAPSSNAATATTVGVATSTAEATITNHYALSASIASCSPPMPAPSKSAAVLQLHPHDHECKKEPLYGALTIAASSPSPSASAAAFAAYSPMPSPMAACTNSGGSSTCTSLICSAASSPTRDSVEVQAAELLPTCDVSANAPGESPVNRAKSAKLPQSK